MVTQTLATVSYLFSKALGESVFEIITKNHKTTIFFNGIVSKVVISIGEKSFFYTVKDNGGGTTHYRGNNINKALKVAKEVMV